LGDVKNITIGHNGRGFGSAWHLDKVFVINMKSNQRWCFPCNRWMAKNEDDGKIERTLFPAAGAQTTYCIKVKTGLEKGAGTDANVFCTLVGESSSSPKLELKFSLTNTNKFERGCLDVFNMDSVDVGKITKMIIGHDNAGLGASWYLDCVEVNNLATGDNFFFPCAQWFDKSKGDKKIERELTAGEKTQELKDEFTEEEEEKDSKKESKKEEKKEEVKSPPPSPRPSADPSFAGGAVTLKVVSGRNLASKDSNGLSDPYCEIYLLDEKGQPNKKSKQKTKVVNKNLNPTWDETFNFTAPPGAACAGILIEMFDKDAIGTDEFMGRIIVPTNNFKMEKDEWIALEQRENKDEEVKGDICVKFSMK